MNEPLLDEDHRDENDETFDSEDINLDQTTSSLLMMEHSIRLVYQNLEIDDKMDKYEQIKFYSNLSQILRSYSKQILKEFRGKFVNQTLVVMRITNVILIRNLYKLCASHFNKKEEFHQEIKQLKNAPII